MPGPRLLSSVLPSMRLHSVHSRDVSLLPLQASCSHSRQEDGGKAKGMAHRSSTFESGKQKPKLPALAARDPARWLISLTYYQPERNPGPVGEQGRGTRCWAGLLQCLEEWAPCHPRVGTQVITSLFIPFLSILSNLFSGLLSIPTR